MNSYLKHYGTQDLRALKSNIVKKMILINHHKNSDIFYKKSLSLLLHTRMEPRDIKKVVKVIKKFYKRYNV
jgi:dTDP-4-amino-4,6-dideoxygalactose transaminase